MALSTVEEGLAIAKDLAKISDTNNDPLLTTFLEAAKGTREDGTTVYRPFIVAAFWLGTHQEALPRQGLIEGDGAKFVDPLKAIEWLLRQQQAMDCGLKFDECWNPKTIKDELICGCDKEETTQSALFGISAMVI
ncbi:MAG: hypothetical protein F6J86_06100 [Symploca sp. SIO1B1]|nr:hypothetical protein [Symploca sp. SIO2D2]NER93394.1 hypothetical protein [Symploca sp. SIO1B1]